MFSPSLADIVQWFVLVFVLLKYFKRFQNILPDIMIWSMLVHYMHLKIWIRNHNCCFSAAFTFLKSLTSLLVNLKRFLTLFWCFCSWLETSKCRLDFYLKRPCRNANQIAVFQGIICFGSSHHCFRATQVKEVGNTSSRHSMRNSTLLIWLVQRDWNEQELRVIEQKKEYL